MQHFESDYMEGAHPLIIERLMSANMEKNAGYGLDSYCDSAKAKIRLACNCPEAQINFLVGGTQTNATVIDAMLRSYQGVIAPSTGHICGHEAGAIEATGHKILAVPTDDGKITAGQVTEILENFLNDRTRDHTVEPGMVYISHPTEYGTLYTKAELQSLHTVCQQHNIPLFLDGARLGYGLMAKGADLTLQDIAQNTDVFYIGGTKVGAFFGEAVVIPNSKGIDHFFTIIKQHGALLAKGWLLGIQFDTLFTDDLYFKISQNAIDMADKLKSAFLEKGYLLKIDASANQLFVILENERMHKLAEKVSFGCWEEYDAKHTVVRFVTSWATKEEDIDELIKLL